MFVLIVSPGAGDELQVKIKCLPNFLILNPHQMQGMKRGITEVADLILVNKSEEPMSIEAQKTLLEYKSAIHYSNQGIKV